MPHAFVNIYIHAVFATKYRQPLINSKVKQEVYGIVIQEVRKMDCHLIAINGMPDHVHILFKLKPTRNLSYVIKQIKGSSSRKIEAIGIIQGFKWQVGYGAFSVSKSAVEKVKRYIKNQEKHHSKSAFDEEYKQLLDLNGFEES